MSYNIRSLIEGQYQFSKQNLDGAFRLSIIGGSTVKAIPSKEKIAKENLKFNAITSALKEIASTPYHLNTLEYTNLVNNVKQWNCKIDSYNQKIEQSKFLRIMNKIIEFISGNHLSLKWKHIEVKIKKPENGPNPELSNPKNPVNASKIAQLNIPDPNEPGIEPAPVAKPISAKKKQPKVEKTIEWDKNDSTQFGKWLQSHCNFFAAHCVNKNNFTRIMEDGFVRSGAELLYTKGLANCEGIFPLKYDQYKKPDIKVLEAKLGPLADRIKELWKKQTDIAFGSDNYPVTTYTGDRHNELYRIITQIFPDDLAAYEDVKIYLETPAPFPVRLAPVYEKFMNHSKTINDSAERKKYINKCWAKLEGIASQLSWLWGRLQHSICAVKNGIAWDYGEVAILRGNPKAILGTKKVHSSIPNEVRFLQPYQNKGKYFSLDLTQEDTIILGPKKMLEPYKAKFPNIQYIEDLTPQQKEFVDSKKTALTSN